MLAAPSVCAPSGRAPVCALSFVPRACCPESSWLQPKEFSKACLPVICVKGPHEFIAPSGPNDLHILASSFHLFLFGSVTGLWILYDAGLVT